MIVTLTDSLHIVTMLVLMLSPNPHAPATFRFYLTRDRHSPCCFRSSESLARRRTRTITATTTATTTTTATAMTTATATADE
mmetsp:Transcript_27455/g.74591  ORF Transcript_27455/g.74591 Transcript_27455/m.74591 type:complete len:82 (-) Transcript_27455:442-687(-)